MKSFSSLILLLNPIIGEDVVDDSTSPCRCWHNRHEYKDFCQNSGYDLANCMSQVNYQGEQKCHWGPEDVYECWKGDHDYRKKMKECGCWSNKQSHAKLCAG